jgi:hypothetical protein
MICARTGAARRRISSKGGKWGGKVGNGSRVFHYEDDSMGPPLKSNVVQGTGAPNRLLAPRDQRRSAGCFIGLENALDSFWGRRYEPNFIDLQIGALMMLQATCYPVAG